MGGGSFDVREVAGRWEDIDCLHTPDSGGGTQLPAQKPLPADGMWQWCVHTGMASYPSCFLNNELFVKSLSVPSPIQKALSATEETGFDTNRIIIVCYTQPGCLCFCWGEANTVWNIILRFFLFQVVNVCAICVGCSLNSPPTSHLLLMGVFTGVRLTPVQLLIYVASYYP